MEETSKRALMATKGGIDLSKRRSIKGRCGRGGWGRKDGGVTVGSVCGIGKDEGKAMETAKDGMNKSR